MEEREKHRCGRESRQELLEVVRERNRNRQRREEGESEKKKGRGPEQSEGWREWRKNEILANPSRSALGGQPLGTLGAASGCCLIVQASVCGAQTTDQHEVETQQPTAVLGLGLLLVGSLLVQGLVPLRGRLEPLCFCVTLLHDRQQGCKHFGDALLHLQRLAVEGGGEHGGQADEFEVMVATPQGPSLQLARHDLSTLGRPASGLQLSCRHLTVKQKSSMVGVNRKRKIRRKRSRYRLR